MSEEQIQKAIDFYNMFVDNFNSEPDFLQAVEFGYSLSHEEIGRLRRELEKEENEE